MISTVLMFAHLYTNKHKHMSKQAKARYLCPHPQLSISVYRRALDVTAIHIRERERGKEASEPHDV